MLDTDTRCSGQDRRDPVRATAQAMPMHKAIIEKDFWVCRVLNYLFQSSPGKDKPIFKRGTGLSKAYNAIERFSEDIDLILDWRLLPLGRSWAEDVRSLMQAISHAAGLKCHRGHVSGRRGQLSVTRVISYQPSVPFLSFFHLSCYAQ